MAIIGDAFIVVRALTKGFKDSVDKSLSGMDGKFAESGNKAGSSFTRGLSQGSGGLSSFKKEALAANDAFSKMVTTGYFLGPAISVAISGISSLVSGFVALVAQAGAAIPALIVIPGVLASIAQAAIVAKVAFGGVGAAIKALGKQKSGGGGANQQKQIETAEKNLARVLESNREALARADENLADAEDRLTEARKSAAESLQQLNFDAEDAAISEKKAAIELEKARERLARVQDLPPNSRARREAELAYAEADLNLRRAKDRNSDLAKETAAANAAGVEGSKEVVAATEAVEEATDAKARAERDALRSQVDAEEALADAKKGTAAAGGGADPLADLSKEAQDFVKYIVSIKGKFKELRAAAGKDLFPLLTQAMQTLVDKLFPVLVPMFQETGKAIGEVAVNLADVVTESSNLSELEEIGETNNVVIKDLGTAFGNLYDMMLSLLTAAGPLITEFSGWIATLTTGWKETLETKNKTGELRDMFMKAGDVAKQLGRIFRNIWEGLKDIGEAAAGPGSGGQLLMDSFEGATKKFSEFTDKLLKDGRLEKFFLDTSKNTEKLGSLATTVVKEFLKLGDNQSIGTFADKIKDVVPDVGTIIDTLTSGSPYLADFADQAVIFFKQFTETKSLEVFFGILTKALGVVNKVFGNESVQKVLLFAAGIMGGVKAFRLMSKAVGFVFRVIGGYILKAVKIVGFLIKAFEGIGMLFGGGAGIGLAVVAAIAAVVAILVMAYKKSEVFRKAIKDLVDVVWGALVDAFNEIKAVLDDVLSKFGGTEGAMKSLNSIFKTIGDVLGKYVVPIIKFGLLIVIDRLKAAIKFFIPIVAAVIKIFSAMWEVVQGIFSLFRGDMDGVKKHFSAAWRAIKDAFFLVWGAIKTFFIDIWNKISGAFSKVWEYIKKAFSAGKDFIVNAFVAVIDFFKNLPSKIGAAFADGFMWLRDKFIAVKNWLWARILDVIDFFTGLPGKIGAAFADGFMWLRDKFTEVKDWLWQRILDIIAFYRGLPSRLGEAFADGFMWLRTKFTAVKDWIALRITDVVNFFINLPGRIGSAFADGFSWIKTKMTEAKNWVSDRIGDIVGFVSGLTGRIATGFARGFYWIKDKMTEAKDWVSDRIDNIVNFVKGIPDRISKFASGLFDGIKNAAKSAFNAVASVWNNTVGKLSFHIPDWVPLIGGKGFDVPDIPLFADGGIVNKATLALIGEAGREAIIPLTNQARAMQIMKQSGLAEMVKNDPLNRDRSGGTIIHLNVYPSKGMDEAELAAMVSRQLAFQLRRGAA